MRVAVFSARGYDERFLTPAAATAGHQPAYFETRLTVETCPLAAGFEAVCAFVNDQLSGEVLDRLAGLDVKVIALRSAGYNHVDLAAARRLGLKVVRVPSYSPYAVAEHAIGLMLSLNRKLHKSYARVREGNFALDGLLGFDLHGRTAGVVGTGQIGTLVARMLGALGCRVLAYDVKASAEVEAAGGQYVPLAKLLSEADIITLHCPLVAETRHMIDTRAIERMRGGVMIVNTSRGALIDAKAVIDGLKSGQIGYLGLDVYEEEADLFFEDHSDAVIQDDIFARLLTFPNVMITGHQAFFTRDALEQIAATTMASLTAIERGDELGASVSLV